jgi:transcriptional regulator with XRE-family HTH domain
MGEINTRIFTLLDEKGLKAADLARFLGVGEGTISAWRRRGTDPKAIYMQKTAIFLGVSRTYLETGKKDSWKGLEKGLGKGLDELFKEEGLEDLFIKDDEMELVEAYRKLDPILKQYVLFSVTNAAKHWNIKDAFDKAREYIENYEKQAPSTQSGLAE